MVNRALLACPYRERREPGDDPVPKIRIIRTRKCACIRHETGVRLVSLYRFFVRFGITFTARAQAKIAYLYFERKVSCKLNRSFRSVSLGNFCKISRSLWSWKMENEKTINRWKKNEKSEGNPLSTILVAGFLA